MKKPPVTLYSSAAERVAIFRRFLAKQATRRVLDTLRSRRETKKLARA